MLNASRLHFQVVKALVRSSAEEEFSNSRLHGICSLWVTNKYWVVSLIRIWCADHISPLRCLDDCSHFLGKLDVRRAVGWQTLALIQDVEPGNIIMPQALQLVFSKRLCYWSMGKYIMHIWTMFIPGFLLLTSDISFNLLLCLFLWLAGILVMRLASS